MEEEYHKFPLLIPTIPIHYYLEKEVHLYRVQLEYNQNSRYLLSQNMLVLKLLLELYRILTKRKYKPIQIWNSQNHNQLVLIEWLLNPRVEYFQVLSHNVLSYGFQGKLKLAEFK
jgi:hypothetical protein